MGQEKRLIDVQSTVNRFVNCESDFAFYQFVGFAVGIYTVGNEHIYQLAVGVTPHYISCKPLVAVGLVGGHIGQYSVGFFKARGVESKRSSIAAVYRIGGSE